jgi:uncharacterized paraquat-inducible protein A
MKYKCKDCEFVIDVPKDVQNMEIVPCPGCGLEMVAHIKKGVITLVALELDGLDYGE